MTTEPLLSPGMRARLAALGAELAALPDPEPPRRCRRPGPEPGERPRARHPRDRVVVRRDRRRARRWVGAGSWPRPSPARSRSTPRPAGSCPSSPPAPTCAGSSRRWPRSSRPPASPSPRSTGSPSRPAPAWPARSWSGIAFAKTLAWAHERPLVGVNHLEGHLYAAWLLDPDEPERPAPPFPLVALVVSGGHTFLVEMRDHLAYRLLGETVDDAAGEAFDKAGRLLGLGYPGGPAIAAAAPDARRHDVVLPRAWLGRLVRLQLLRAQDRPPAPGRGGAGGGRDGRAARRAAGSIRRVSRSWPGASRRRSSTCSPPRRCARPTRRPRGPSSSAAASPRTTRSGRGSRPAPRLVACRSSCPRPGLCTDNGAMIGAAGWHAVRGRGARRQRPRGAAGLAARPPGGAPETRRPPRRGPAARAYEVALAAERDAAGAGLGVPAPRQRARERRPARSGGGPPDASRRRPASAASLQPELPGRRRRPRGDPRRGGRRRPAGRCSRSAPASGSSPAGCSRPAPP